MAGVRWAADLALGPDERQRAVGLYILGDLAKSTLATTDLHLFDAFSDRGVMPLEALSNDEPPGDTGGGESDVTQEDL